MDSPPSVFDRPIPLGVGRKGWVILTGCLIFGLLLVYLDYAVNYSYGTNLNPIRRLFNITREDSLASWFGTTLMFMVALTFWFIRSLNRHSGRFVRFAWLLLAIFFTYLAIDDGAEIHERMGSAFEDTQERARSTGTPMSWAGRWHAKFPSYEWQLLFMPAFAALGLFAAIFLWTRFNGICRFMMLASFGLMAVAVGLDFIEGLEPKHPWNVYTWINNKYDLDPYTVPRFREVGYEALRHFSKAIEEFLEMMAAALLWVALLKHADAKFETSAIPRNPGV